MNFIKKIISLFKKQETAYYIHNDPIQSQMKDLQRKILYESNLRFY